MRTDLTVLLTHIGLENDIKLAGMLDPDWGVSMIIGGHSHTFMDKPEVVNGVPIVHAGTGTGLTPRIAGLSLMHHAFAQCGLPYLPEWSTATACCVA